MKNINSDGEERYREIVLGDESGYVEGGSDSGQKSEVEVLKNERIPRPLFSGDGTLDFSLADVEEVHAAKIISQVDYEFLNKIVFLGQMDPEVVKLVMNVRNKLNHDIKMTQEEAQILFDRLKCKSFPQTNLDISGLTFVKDLDLSDGVVGGDFIALCTKVLRDNDQSNMIVEGENYQNEMKVGGDNRQSGMKVGGGNLQVNMEVGGCNNQNEMEVGGNIDQRWMEVNRDNNQGNMEVGGNIDQRWMKVTVDNNQGNMKVGGDNIQVEMQIGRTNQQQNTQIKCNNDQSCMKVGSSNLQGNMRVGSNNCQIGMNVGEDNDQLMMQVNGNNHQVMSVERNNIQFRKNYSHLGMNVKGENYQKSENI